ncbi:retrovirus-related Pol polyprotein from transposon 297 [Trichonephila clavipes]|nr:retrovirus-related Pol polyprotein from transposon 297 [Trichonephila clavipes]
MGLYLTIFERQAKFLNIPEKTWAAYLIGSLPPDIAQLIAREDEDDAQNYEKVKEMLLKRFRVIGYRFRQYFSQQKKNPDSTWRDFYFELSSYFEGWIKELKITTFDQLKSLIIADQIKRKTPANIKEHFLDIWADLSDPLELAEKLDAYDSLRPGMKNLYPSSKIVLKIFGEKIAVCADTGASHTIAGEKLFKFLQEHDVTFMNKRISFMMADGIRQTIMALSTIVDLYIEDKVIPTEFLVLPEAKGNRTLLGLDFLNAAGIVLDF